MMVLVTGGSGSGKSAFAEEKLLSLGEGRRIYIATMECYDQESRERVKRHRAMRLGKGFETAERPLDLKGLELPSGGLAILECMSNLTANEMFDENGAGENTVREILEGVKRIKEQLSHLVIVTNEIFSEALPYEGDTDSYRKTLGEINRRLAEEADQVYEVVYGIPVCLKGGAG